ncbi:hypothetical protein KP004_16555 [Geomonas oryzisoli]|uniref:Uncharacterized protein n=1 Tax=Geomonas oryzisoli TaxID=2847992 RepID=A0ABX8J6K5_9BACT|nr:hypothetical protein [Geomonas oryzisoli]QWV92771.1 hypothetical protein KP004_16555 [Geomonas oryzisoli]
MNKRLRRERQASAMNAKEILFMGRQKAFTTGIKVFFTFFARPPRALRNCFGSDLKLKAVAQRTQGIRDERKGDPDSRGRQKAFTRLHGFLPVLCAYSVCFA